MNKDYKISIIVPIYNRPDELDDLLHSIDMARIPEGMSYEVVVIEDGSAIKSDAVSTVSRDPSVMLTMRKFTSSP